MTVLPFVSVIVLNFNGQRHLEVVLSSLERQSYPRNRYEIILADNGSTDDSLNFTEEHFPNIKIHRLEKNYGFAEGNNQAARQADGNVLAFLNNDTEADEYWLEELVRAYQENPDAMYGSQAFNFFHRTISANSVAQLTAWGIPTKTNVYRVRKELESGLHPSMYADAAGMLVQKDIFFLLGGFDSSYFAYEEEKDLGWKGWLLGYPSYVVTASVYYHKGGATLGEHSFRAIYLLWRNGLRNIIKYPNGPSLLTILPLHVAFSLGAFLRIFLPLRRYRLLVAMLGAYIAAVIRLPWLLRERAYYQRNRKKSDRQLKQAGLWLSLSASLALSRIFMRRRAALPKAEESTQV
jgi:GT2 family glycosyltransferase